MISYNQLLREKIQYEAEQDQLVPGSILAGK